jgi:hypothetical protein
MSLETRSGPLSFPRAKEEKDEDEKAQNGCSDSDGVEQGGHR